MSDKTTVPVGLTALKTSLDIQIEAEKATTGDVSLRTALAWWDVATAIRDWENHNG